MRLKNAAEDIFSLFGRRQKQLGKIALRKHCYLRKLLPVYAQNFGDRPVYILNLGYHFAIGEGEFRVGFFESNSLASGFFALVFGVALYGIQLAAAGKAQLHLRGRFGQSVL